MNLSCAGASCYRTGAICEQPHERPTHGGSPEGSLTRIPVQSGDAGSGHRLHVVCAVACVIQYVRGDRTGSRRMVRGVSSRFCDSRFPAPVLHALLCVSSCCPGLMPACLPVSSRHRRTSDGAQQGRIAARRQASKAISIFGSTSHPPPAPHTVVGRDGDAYHPRGYLE